MSAAPVRALPGAPAGKSTRKHVISVMVENRPGVLARVAGLFARRGYNINSLAVSATENPDVSRMTVTTTGDESDLEQIVKQLNKLIDVIQVFDHTNDALVAREIALFKMRANAHNRMEILQLATVFGAQIISMTPADETLIVEITGDEEKIDAFQETLSQYQVLEMVRTGTIALVRGARIT
jgi:acetolactate synthase-1/3 small subunit